MFIEFIGGRQTANPGFKKVPGFAFPNRNRYVQNVDGEARGQLKMMLYADSICDLTGWITTVLGGQSSELSEILLYTPLYGLWNELSAEVFGAVSVNVLNNCGKHCGSTVYFHNIYLTVQSVLSMNVHALQDLCHRHKLRFPNIMRCLKRKKRTTICRSNSTRQRHSSQLHQLNSSHF